VKTSNGQITWVLFDLGGVLIEVDQARIFKGLSALTGKTLDVVRAALLTQQEFWEGFITTEHLASEVAVVVNRVLGSQLAVEAIVGAFNAELGEVIRPTADLLPSLRTKARVGCLSNTNTLHWECMLKECDFMSHFDRRFASQLVGYAKPSLEIYQAVSSNLGVRPEEILFFDDKIENVNAASSLGWNARVYAGHQGLLRHLSECNLL
jgi:putative hydrolase of the HAD superfamily